MLCIYCGEELKRHEHIQDNLFECPNCEITFEIFPVIGLSSIILVSVYQYAKLRFNGVSRDDAMGVVLKQAAFSTSVLVVSMIAQSAFGGFAGIIVSTSIGVVYLGYNVVQTIHRRNFEERLRVYTIEQYRRIALS